MFELSILVALMAGDVQINRMYIADTAYTEEALDYSKCTSIIEKMAGNRFQDVLMDGEEFVYATCVSGKVVQRFINEQ